MWAVPVVDRLSNYKIRLKENFSKEAGSGGGQGGGHQGREGAGGERPSTMKKTIS